MNTLEFVEILKKSLPSHVELRDWNDRWHCAGYPVDFSVNDSGICVCRKIFIDVGKAVTFICDEITRSDADWADLEQLARTLNRFRDPDFEY